MPWPFSGTKVAPGPADVPKKYIDQALKQMVENGEVMQVRDANGNRTPEEDIVDGDKLMKLAKELMEKKGGRRGRHTRRRRHRHRTSRRY
jgi:hypothetical protein